MLCNSKRGEERLQIDNFNPQKKFSIKFYSTGADKLKLK